MASSEPAAEALGNQATAAPAAPAAAESQPTATASAMVPLGEVQTMINNALAQQNQQFLQVLQAQNDRLLTVIGQFQGQAPQPQTPLPPNLIEQTQIRLAAIDAGIAEAEADLWAGEYLFEISKPEEPRMTKIVGGWGGTGNRPTDREKLAQQMATAKYRDYFGITSEEPHRLIKVRALTKDEVQAFLESKAPAAEPQTSGAR